jgi:hypothetical protein
MPLNLKTVLHILDSVNIHQPEADVQVFINIFHIKCFICRCGL